MKLFSKHILCNIINIKQIITMKKISLLLICIILFIGQQAYGQNPFKSTTYKNGGVENEIRTLTAEGKTGVLLECGDYLPDYSEYKGENKYLRRKKWFCLEQEEIPVFISILDNLKVAYTLLLKNGAAPQVIDSLELPSIGNCIVANFEQQNGFMLTERDSFLASPTFLVRTNSKSVFFDYQFKDDEIGEVEDNGVYFTACDFSFRSPEEITDLRNKLNNLLQQY